MLKRSSVAITIVLMALAVPAFGETYTFEIDEELSTLGFASGAYETRLEGTFSLELDGSSPTWSGNVELEDVYAWNLDLLNLYDLYIIQPGNVKLIDFDEDDNDFGTLTYNGATHIASGIVNTEHKDDMTIDTMAPVSRWQGPFDWTVEVSDDNFIGSKEPGWTPEARLTMSGSVDQIPFDVQLVGAVVPEPSSVAMLISGCLCAFGLAWRRRQRRS